MRAFDVMTTEVITVDENATVPEAAKLMTCSRHTVDRQPGDRESPIQFAAQDQADSRDTLHLDPSGEGPQ